MCARYPQRSKGAVPSDSSEDSDDVVEPRLSRTAIRSKGLGRR